MSEHSDTDRPHFTTRRGFIGAAGCGVLSLYGLWAAYGASPLNPFSGAGNADGHGGHGGHGGPLSGPSPEEFRKLTQQFIQANRQADGSVQPGGRSMSADAAQHAHGSDAQAGHAAVTAPATSARDASHAHDNHADRGAAVASSEHVGHAAVQHTGPQDTAEVYLMAYQWAFEPALLRLQAHQTYRLRMMALDTAHGASVQLGGGSRVIRLRPGVMVEQTLQFTARGSYLLYCTVYCGLAHERMQGKIIVV